MQGQGPLSVPTESPSKRLVLEPSCASGRVQLHPLDLVHQVRITLPSHTTFRCSFLLKDSGEPTFISPTPPSPPLPPLCSWLPDTLNHTILLSHLRSSLHRCYSPGSSLLPSQAAPPGSGNRSHQPSQPGRAVGGSQVSRREPTARLTRGGPAHPWPPGEQKPGPLG